MRPAALTGGTATVVASTTTITTITEPGSSAETGGMSAGKARGQANSPCFVSGMFFVSQVATLSVREFVERLLPHYDELFDERTTDVNALIAGISSDGDSPPIGSDANFEIVAPID